jgi:hypothetical protein
LHRHVAALGARILFDSNGILFFEIAIAFLLVGKPKWKKTRKRNNLLIILNIEIFPTGRGDFFVHYVKKENVIGFNLKKRNLEQNVFAKFRTRKFTYIYFSEVIY